MERTDIIEDGGNWQVRYTYTTIKLEEEWTYIIEDKGDWQVRYTFRQVRVSILPVRVIERIKEAIISGGD